MDYSIFTEDQILKAIDNIEKEKSVIYQFVIEDCLTAPLSNTFVLSNSSSGVFTSIVASIWLAPKDLLVVMTDQQHDLIYRSLSKKVRSFFSRSIKIINHHEDTKPSLTDRPVYFFDSGLSLRYIFQFKCQPRF